MKLRDAANALKTVSAIHMRDAGNVLRTVQTVHMRDAANALKVAYSSAPAASMSISPPAYSRSGSSPTNSAPFTASFVGGTPTSIVWSVSGPGAILSGQGTATVLVQASDTVSDGNPVTVNIACTAVIAGVTQTATAVFEYSYGSREIGGGGGVNP